MATITPNFKIKNNAEIQGTGESTVAGSLTVIGNVTGTFIGNGAGITNLEGSAIATGLVNPARLGTGTTDITTFLRGDGTWASAVTAVSWGSIVGTLSSQTDLQSALNLKAPTASPTFTGTIILPTGTAAAAPMFLSAGVNLTTPLAGAVEWDGVDLYLTRTTGPTRKTVAFTDSPMSGNTTGSAASLTTPRTFSITGKVTAGGVTFDGTGNVALNVTAASLATSDITSGTLAVARGGTGLASYAVGDLVYASGAGALASLADVATGNVLISGGVGAAPSYGKVGLTSHVSGVLPVANGGTNLSAVGTANQLFSTNVGGTAFEHRTITGTNGVSVSFGAGTVTVTSNATSASTASTIVSRDGSGNFSAAQITVAADPTSALQVATKQYVDNVAQGIDAKASVVASTTGNVTLSGGAPSTVDGVALALNSRVLVKSQTAPAQNGIYVVTTLGTGSNGTWARSQGANTWAELPSAFVWVEQGTVFADTGWVCTADSGGTLETTAITWVQFSGSATYSASNGVILTGNNFALTGNALSLHNLATNGLVARTGTGAVTARSITTPTEGLTVTNGDGVAGNPSIVLSDDVAAIEAMAGTGISVRTATNTWALRSIAASGVGISITNADGVGGNITITSNATNANTASAVVARDASGNFTAGTITAALAGNASTATTLQTARTIAISGKMTAAGVSFNGSANISLAITAAALDAADITTGTLPVARGGTGVTTSTGSGSVVLSASPTFTGTVTVPAITVGSGTTTSVVVTAGAMWVEKAGTLTTAATTQVDLDTWPVATFRSAKYVVQVLNTVTGDVELTEILVSRNDANDVAVSEYGTLLSGANLCDFTADYNGSTNVRLRVTPMTANSTQFKFQAVIFNN